MENICFNLAQLHLHGTAFYDFLRLRKLFFVDQLGWDIPHDDEVEMDQYDNPTAYYSLILREGQVIGGSRVMATTAQWGSHTYMLRDAIAGKLPGIPTNILPKAVAWSNVWEITRVVISDQVTTQADRTKCLSMMLDGATRLAWDQGATELMSLSPMAMERTLRKLGFGAVRIGEAYRNLEDGRRYACLSMPVDGKARGAPAASAAQNQSPPHGQFAVHAPSRI